MEATVVMEVIQAATQIAAANAPQDRQTPKATAHATDRIEEAGSEVARVRVRR